MMEGFPGKMGRPRPCGCKGVRTCLVCETDFGAVKRDIMFGEESRSYVYCFLCNKAWEGWGTNVWDEHPNHDGEPYTIPGIYIEMNFITPEEQETLINDMDALPWDASQSGRRKQNYGPKCNFKKRKMKPGDFNGFPKFSEFIQQRFSNVSLLEGFRTVEQCSLEYTSERGASIDPHIDDCWVWGERIVTVNVIGDSMLTLNRYAGPQDRYNLADVPIYPRVVSHDGTVVWNPMKKDLSDVFDPSEKKEDSRMLGNAEQSQGDACVSSGCMTSGSCPNESKDGNSLESENQCCRSGNKSEKYLQDDAKSTVRSFTSFNFSKPSDSNDSFPIIRVPMPARSLLVIYGAARYEWEHSVLREDISGRRVCLAYREFTPPFLRGGLKEQIGSEVLQKATNFW